MPQRAPKSLYHATFSSRGSTPVSPVANSCCGPMDAPHESVVMDLTTVLNKREYEIRSLIQKNMALTKILQDQGRPITNSRVSTSTYGKLPSHYVEMRDDVGYPLYMQQEEHRMQLDGGGKLQSRDMMMESLQRENARMKEKTIALEKTVTTLTDEIDTYKEQLLISTTLTKKQSSFRKENERAINDLKEKNTDLWKKWKKEEYTVKCKDAVLNMQRQRLDELENLLQTYEEKFPNKVVDIRKLLARVDEGERLWSKIDMRESRFKERKSIIHNLREENANLKNDKKLLQEEVEQLKRCSTSLQLELLDTGDKIDMKWLMSQLRDKATLKEKNAELEEIIAGKGFTVKAAEAEQDLRKKEFELATQIEEINTVLGILRGHSKDIDNIETSKLINNLELALLMIGNKRQTNKRVGALVQSNATLKGQVAELEEIIQGQGYTVKAAAAEKDLRAKEVDLEAKVNTINDVLEALNDVIDGVVNNTEVTVLLRRLEDVLSKFSYQRDEIPLEIVSQHSIISEVGWNLGCVTYQPHDYAALAVAKSASTLTADDDRTLSSAKSDAEWTQLLSDASELDDSSEH